MDITRAILVKSIGDLVSRISGDRVYYPISRNPLIPVAIAGYALVLLITLNGIIQTTPVRGGLPEGADKINPVWIFICIAAVSSWSYILRYSDRLFYAGIPWLRVRWMVFPVIYFSSNFFAVDSYTLPYIGALVLHGALLAGIYEIYSHPLIPPRILNMDRDSRVTYLENHVTNWWRITQIGITGALAVIIGLATNYYLAVQQQATIFILILFIGPVALGIGSFVMYFIWKMYAFEYQIYMTNKYPNKSS